VRVAHLALLVPGVLVACAGLAPTPPNPFDGLTDADRARAQAARQEALETGARGEVFEWSGDGAGTGGSITVLETLRRSDGAYCRRFREVVRAQDASDQFDAMFCRDDGGRWLP
jgi:surface antigen